MQVVECLDMGWTATV